jgi:hypothetical protein
MLYILQVQRLMCDVTQRDRQHAHQLRKKEHEIVLIQEQLGHSLGLGRAAARHNYRPYSSNKQPACETCSGSTDCEEGDQTV